jgi:phosphoribosylanthranilate isomerase
MIVKICGTTNLADARFAVDCGADMLGFIFYPPSPRYVEPAVAAEIIASLPAEVARVGIFVNESVDHMTRIAEQAGLTALQLHGDEPAGMITELAGYRVIKALSLRTDDDLARLDAYSAAELLIDTPCEQWGGSGKTGDWALASEAASRHPIILAGGLTPDNVAAAIAAVCPVGVDAISGVEAAKGTKDPDKVRAFIAAARRAGAGQ